MFRGIVERIRVIELGLAFREIARDHECRAEQGMPEHERDCRSMLLRQRQALRRKLTHSIGLKRHKVRHPKTEEDRKQNQWVLDRFARCLGAFDKYARLFEGGFGFRRRKALG